MLDTIAKKLAKDMLSEREYLIYRIRRIESLIKYAKENSGN